MPLSVQVLWLQSVKGKKTTSEPMGKEMEQAYSRRSMTKRARSKPRAHILSANGAGMLPSRPNEYGDCDCNCGELISNAGASQVGSGLLREVDEGPAM